MVFLIIPQPGNVKPYQELVTTFKGRTCLVTILVKVVISLWAEVIIIANEKLERMRTGGHLQS